MQAKHIPDRPILQQLATDPRWHTWWNGEGVMPSVATACPPETPPKVVLAKMRGLIKRGLVKGCICGCRGDFEITEKGRRYLDPPASA